MAAPENSTWPPGTLGKRIKSSMLSTRHLCCSCFHPSPAAPVSTALGRSALSTDSPSNGNSTFASVHCMKSFVAFAMTADKLYREQRNTCPVQLGHCLCMLGIVLSLVCFFFLSLHCPVVCYCLWILLAMGDTVLLLGTWTWRKAETAAPQLSSLHPLEERGLGITVLNSRQRDWGV